MSKPEENEPAAADAPGTANRDDAGSRSLRDELAGLHAAARSWAAAELAYHQARAALVGAGARRTLAFGVMAAVLAVFALFGFVFGLILALSPLMTAWGATAAVVGTLVLAALLCVSCARRAWKHVRTAIDENGQKPEGDRE